MISISFTSLKFLLKIATWLVIIVGVLGSVLFPIYVLYNLGGKFGVLALVFYSLSLLPGILRRLNIFPLLRSIFMLFRKEFGVMMFLPF